MVKVWTIGFPSMQPGNMSSPKVTSRLHNVIQATNQT